MNYEKKYLIQKKRADSLESKVRDLETKVLILQNENHTFAKNQEVYNSAIESAIKAETEYRKLLEETKDIKDKYLSAINECENIKNKYTSKMKQLMKQKNRRWVII